jgi:hypothetical protein
MRPEISSGITRAHHLSVKRIFEISFGPMCQGLPENRQKGPVRLDFVVDNH